MFLGIRFGLAGIFGHVGVGALRSTTGLGWNRNWCGGAAVQSGISLDFPAALHCGTASVPNRSIQGLPRLAPRYVGVLACPWGCQARGQSWDFGGKFDSEKDSI